MKILPALLLVLFTALASLLAAEGPSSKDPKGFKNVGVEEFDRLRAGQDTVVLDVRTPKEFEAGHIPGAINIDWNATADFNKKIAALDKSKTYLVHCAVGGRSAKAGEKMAALKFNQVYNLVGGFNAWAKAGKPTEKPAAP